MKKVERFRTANYSDVITDLNDDEISYGTMWIKSLPKESEVEKVMKDRNDPIYLLYTQDTIYLLIVLERYGIDYHNGDKFGEYWREWDFVRIPR